MGAFFAALPSDTKRTKGLRTLRDVTGNADDPTSPIVRRNEINTNSSSSRSRTIAPFKTIIFCYHILFPVCVYDCVARVCVRLDP